jgi:hypothetical protein
VRELIIQQLDAAPFCHPAAPFCHPAA